MKPILSLLIACSVIFGQNCWEPHTPGHYPTATKISRLNHNYQANWSTSETPGAENWGGWQDMGICEDGTTEQSNTCWETHRSGMYKLGAEVSYLGFNYRAAWTTSETPGVENWGGWTEIGECEADPIALADIILSNESITEAAGDNAIVGYLSTNLTDAGTIIYRLVAGSGDSDNNLFSIQNNILRAQHSLVHSDNAIRSILIEAMASDGTIYTEAFTIAVNKAVVTDDLTDITITPTTISHFVLYSHDDLNISSKTTVEGVIGANANVQVSDVDVSNWKTTINGDIWVNGSVITNSEAELNGSIYAPNGINLGWNATHNGDVHTDIPVPFFTIPTKTVPVSADDITVAWNEQLLLMPGSYGDVSLSDGSSLVLTAGTYNMSTLALNSNGIKIYIDIQPGETVELNVEDNLRFGSEAEFVFMNKFSPASLKIHTNQFNELILPNLGKINGTITAPNTTARINSGAVIYGAIYAKKIDVGYDVTIIRPPFLTDIWHSEWAYAPPFDMNQMNYTGIIPLNTNNVNLDYQILYPNLTVQINGDTDLKSVGISSDDEQVLFTVTNQSGVSSDYTLNLKTATESVIYVDATPSGTGNNGTSWANAYKDLQDAIEEAVKSGKEIWLAEGTYIPSYQVDPADSRTKTFLLYQGIEIIGSFIGDETKKSPKGSPYKTILSGDIEKNDHENAFTSFPFTESAYASVDDNSYHVVTINGINRAKSTRLEGVTISSGVADGLGDNSYGGGVFSKYAHPAIEACIIRDNYALSHGAGIYAGGGLQSFSLALFKNNISLNGSGAALYINHCDSVTLTRVVFDGNQAIGADNNAFGGAIFSNKCNISFESSIFYSNYAKSSGSIIYAKDSDLLFRNVTATQNGSSTTSGAIRLDESKADIVNTILWDNDGEVIGDSTRISISYSCISGGYNGVGNISATPNFTGGEGSGDDATWGTDDDGLKLQKSSPCINTSDTLFPEYDILFAGRAIKDNRDEIGAYTYIAPPSPSNSGSELGYLKQSGEFIPANEYHSFEPFDNNLGLVMAFTSDKIYHLRFLLEHHSYTEGISSGPVTFTGYNGNNNNAVVFSKRLDVQRAPDHSWVNGRMVYYSQKLIMLVNNKEIAEEYQEEYGHLGIIFIYANSEITHFSTNAHTNDYR